MCFPAVQQVFILANQTAGNRLRGVDPADLLRDCRTVIKINIAVDGQHCPRQCIHIAGLHHDAVVLVDKALRSAAAGRNDRYAAGQRLQIGNAE